MSKESYTPWDSAQLLTDDEVIIEYLKAALEENDPAYFMRAVGNVARAKGVNCPTQEPRSRRASLHKSLLEERDPGIGAVMKALDGIGVQLTIAPKQV